MRSPWSSDAKGCASATIRIPMMTTTSSWANDARANRENPTPRSHRSRADADVHEFLRVMRRAESRRAPGRWTRDAAFDPGTWRQLAVARELERRRRLRDNGEASTHRQPLVGLPDRLVRRASTFEELNKARVGPRVENRAAQLAALRRRQPALVSIPPSERPHRGQDHRRLGSPRQGRRRRRVRDLHRKFRRRGLGPRPQVRAPRFTTSACTHWLKIHASCPICREEVTRMSLVDRHDVFTRRRRRYVRDDAEAASRGAAP